MLVWAESLCYYGYVINDVYFAHGSVFSVGLSPWSVSPLHSAPAGENPRPGLESSEGSLTHTPGGDADPWLKLYLELSVSGSKVPYHTVARFQGRTSGRESEGGRQWTRETEHLSFLWPSLRSPMLSYPPYSIGQSSHGPWASSRERACGMNYTCACVCVHNCVQLFLKSEASFTSLTAAYNLYDIDQMK